MNSREAAVSPCQERDFWSGDPEPARGEESGNVERRAAGCECFCISPMTNGKENLGEHSALRSLDLCSAKTLDPNSQPHEAACRFQRGRTGKHARSAPSALHGAISVRQLAQGEPSWPGVAGELLSWMTRRSPVPSSLSQDSTTKWRGLRPDQCHAALLVPSRPLRAALAVASGQPGQRSALRQTPRVPRFLLEKRGVFQMREQPFDQGVVAVGRFVFGLDPQLAEPRSISSTHRSLPNY